MTILSLDSGSLDRRQSILLTMLLCVCVCVFALPPSCCDGELFLAFAAQTLAPLTPVKCWLVLGLTSGPLADGADNEVPFAVLTLVAVYFVDLATAR